MIADRKLGDAKKGDDIAYVSGDLEDKSEEEEVITNDDSVEADKQESVDI